MKTRSRALSLAGLVDAAAVLALLAAALVGLQPVYGGAGWLIPAAGGVVVGAAVAFAAAWLRLGPLITAGAAILAYFLTGPGLALRGIPGMSVLPTGPALRELLFGSVQVWRDFVTTTPPVSRFPELALVPFIIGLASAVVMMSLAWRVRRPAWALVPFAVAWAAVIALGTSDVAWPLAQGLAAVAVALVWLAWRRREAVRAAAPDGRAAGTAGAAGGAGAVGDPGASGAPGGSGVPAGSGGAGGASAATSWPVRLATMRGTAILLAVGVAAATVGYGSAGGSLERLVIRDQIVPPLDLRQYASPLVGFRQLVGVKKDKALLTVQGLPENARLRLAVMDGYDGTVYNVTSAAGTDSGLYDRAAAEQITDAVGPSQEVTVTVGDYSGVWVPDAGALTALSFAGPRAEELQDALYYNAATGGAVAPAGLREGDSYTFAAVVEESEGLEALTGSALANASLPALQSVPDVVAGAGSEFAGDSKVPAERILSIVTALQDPTQAFFSHGLDGEVASPPGHSAARVQSFLTADQMIGDDEQYAVAMALMLRQLGMPARVVMGFKAGESSQISGDTWTVKGADAHAWVEVKFEDAGWVPIDPTPPENQILTEQEPRAKDKPNPQVLQPPPPPEEPAELPPENLPEDSSGDDEDAGGGLNWAAIGRLVLMIGLPLLILLGPPAVIWYLKRRRRLRRQRLADPSMKLSGGWRELTDYAVDLGVHVPAAGTRRENGRLLADRGSPAAVQLAERADAGVWGSYYLSDAEVAAFWADVATARKQLGEGSGFMSRIRAAVSVSSLRTGRRAPGPRRLRRRVSRVTTVQIGKGKP
ncbi:MAG: transglutaminase-like domain-containing protein [Bifidobacteriaceae bacterium]|jgi:hypothetical protein|nr:transglutaminase-like domain-containing protein [Bifidobacteriaceae bacterium]